MSQIKEKTTEDLKSIWRHLKRLMKKEEWETAFIFVKSLLDEGDVSSMRMGLDVVKDYEEMNEVKESLRSKIESIIEEKLL